MSLTLRPGNRIRLLAMQDDPFPIPVGEVGTVVHVWHHDDKGGWDQIDIAWDSGRKLMLVSPPDEFEIIGDDPVGGATLAATSPTLAHVAKETRG